MKASRSNSPFRQRRVRRTAGFTLVEVMITMFLLSLTGLAVFSGLQQITRAMTAVAIRDEAYHLLQAEAERLLAGDYQSFAATTSDQLITSAFKTSYAPSFGVSKFAVSARDAAGRVQFTRRVVAVASTTTSKTLRVEVEWNWSGGLNRISTPLYRTP